MKIILLITGLTLGLAAGLASAQQLTGDITHSSTRPVRDIQTNQDLIYGYGPGFLTEKKQYSSTAEQEGHYVLGSIERPQARMDHGAIRKESTPTATSGVLLSVPRPVRQQEVTEPANPSPRQARDGRVATADELERAVEEHKWTTPF